MSDPAHTTPPPARRPVALVAALVAALAAGACDVGHYLGERPEDRLVEEVVAQWTELGHPFLDGVTGTDTVASVTATGARGWEVGVGPLDGGLPSVWALEIPRAEVIALVPGAAFATWLDERVRAGGVAEGLPPGTGEAVRDGELRAVGDLEVRFGPANRSGRTTVERVAYLVPRRFSDLTEWRVQPDSSDARALVEALAAAVDAMVRTDPRMRACLGAAPERAERSERLRCWAEVVTRRFEAR